MREPEAFVRRCWERRCEGIHQLVGTHQLEETPGQKKRGGRLGGDWRPSDFLLERACRVRAQRRLRFGGRQDARHLLRV